MPGVIPNPACNMQARKTPAVFLMGPTASGKTALAVELVARSPLAVISVDSAMVYRGLDIGTGKPAGDILRRAPHRLIDICDPSRAYSAARFRVDALREMRAITAAGQMPLLVGGSGLYFRVLQHGLTPLPRADPDIRAQLEAEAKTSGWPALHARLADMDPQSAARIHPHDRQRIQRALEVVAITGMTRTELFTFQQAKGMPYRLIKLVIAPSDRAQLRQRIRDRFLAMLGQGLVNEVHGLFQRGDLHSGLPAIRSVGYRQLWAYLNGELTYDQAVTKAITATNRLAKRQLTWLRRETDAVWFDSEDPNLLEKLLIYMKKAGVG